MSRYIPTFDGSTRWLEDGKTLPSATLKTELDAVKTAEDANAAIMTGTSDLTFKKGFAIRYNVADMAANKACGTDFKTSADEYVASDLAALPSGATRIVPGDTADDFQTIKLDKDCQAFGKKHMLIQVLAYQFDTTVGDDVLHPAATNTNPAYQVVVRESSLPSDEAAGHHPFCGGLTAADAEDGTINYVSYNATETQRGSVAIRNLNNSFMFRIGTQLTNGTATAELVFRILDAWD